MMHRTFSHLFLFLLVALSLTLFGGGCSSGPDVPTKSDNRGDVPGQPPEQAPKKEEGSDLPSTSVVPTDPALSSADPLIVWAENEVNLKRKGAQSVIQLFENPSTPFYLGDTLQIGQASSANIYCENRGICQLSMGTYSECCGDQCHLNVPMMLRRPIGLPGQIVKKAELDPAAARELSETEGKIRDLKLSQVTTQFLITKLYSNWRLDATDQELKRLSEQLAKPETKQELKGLYAPIIQKTGEMDFRFHRVDDAKKLYQLNISSLSEANDAKGKAAAHAGLAEAYSLQGDRDNAVQNYKTAKDIYLKEGETKSADAADRQIKRVQALAPQTTTSPKPRPIYQKAPVK